MTSGGISIRRVRLALLSLPGIVLLAACGSGGTLVAGGGTGGTGISTGVMTVGSVIVNGVRFDDNLATVTIDDSPGSTGALRDGMVVTVRGTFNDDGLTGQAEAIEVENEVRGPVSAKGVDTLTVLGQTVLVNGATVFANVTDFEAIVTTTDVVEVHGNRKADGTIVASRVELVTGAGLLDELRGTVSLLDNSAQTFSLGAQQVSYATGQLLPAGATFDNGALVEVRGALNESTGVLEATTVGVEDLQDVEFRPTEGKKLEVEGFVSEYVSTGAPFSVGTQAAMLAAGVRYKGGVSADMEDGILVEAKGRFAGGILVADEIRFKDAIRIESTVQSAADNSFALLGKTIFVTGNTENNHGPIAANDNVKVRGFLNQDNVTITASRIDHTGSIEEDRHILQAQVGPFDSAARTLTLLGIEVNASGPGVQFRDDRNDDLEDQPLTAAEFFDALTEGRTVVKARGTPGEDPVTSLTANQVELE